MLNRHRSSGVQRRIDHLLRIFVFNYPALDVIVIPDLSFVQLQLHLSFQQARLLSMLDRLYIAVFNDGLMVSSAYPSSKAPVLGTDREHGELWGGSLSFSFDGRICAVAGRCNVGGDDVDTFELTCLRRSESSMRLVSCI